MQQKTILILKDNRNPRLCYLIDHLALHWKQNGYDVLTHYGIKDPPPADVVILHIDKTLVPEAYVDCVSHYPVVLNRRILNISKRVISRNTLEYNDTFDGSVIVKTDLNYGGVPEDRDHWFSPLKKRIPSWLIRNWQKIEVLNPEKYPVYGSKESVPAAVWQNRRLIVEKYLPEMERGLYYLRYWIFFGNAGWAGRFGSREPVVKFRNMMTEDERISVPSALKSIREQMGFDYGRFDYVERDGKVVLFDVNKTIGGAHQIDRYADQLRILAGGMRSYLNE